MKNQATKKFLTFILLLSGMLSSSFSNAQDCPSSKVWACRYDVCGIQECKCIAVSQVQKWLATTPACSWKIHTGHGGTWRIGQSDSGLGVNIYPNPVFSSTTISFILEQPGKVSVKIFDVSGRLAATLADGSFEEGGHDIVWNAADVSQGIYVLQFHSEEDSELVKLVITR